MRRTLHAPLRALRDPFSGVGWDRMSTRLGVALLVVSAIFFAANFAAKAWTSYEVRKVRQQRLAQIAQLTQQIGQMRHDLAYYQSRAYYVEAARAYGYVLPGDIQVTISAPTPDTTTSGPSAPAPSAQAHHKKQQSWLVRAIEALVPGF